MFLRRPHFCRFRRADGFSWWKLGTTGGKYQDADFYFTWYHTITIWTWSRNHRRRRETQQPLCSRNINSVTTMEAGNTRFAALGYKNFRLIWWGLIVSNMGTWMQNVANGWLGLPLTYLPLWVGFLRFSFAIPMILIPPFAGAVVDRVHRVKLLFFTQSMQLLNA